MNTPAGRPVRILGDQALITLERWEEISSHLDSDPRIVTVSIVANPMVRSGWLRSTEPAGPVIVVALDTADLIGETPRADGAGAADWSPWFTEAANRGLAHEWLITNHVDVAAAPEFLSMPEPMLKEMGQAASAAADAWRSRKVPATLRICVDATWLGQFETGAQVLTTHALAALAANSNVAEINVVGVDAIPAYAAHLAELPRITFHTERPSEAADIVWYPNQIDARVDIGAARELGRRVVTSYLDLIAYDIPRYHGSPEAWHAYRSLQRTIALTVDGITTISQDVADRLLTEVPALQEERVRTIPLGVDHIAVETVDVPPSEIAHLVDRLSQRPFLLVLGNDFRHKNRDFTIRVWEEILQQGMACDLVLAGLHVKGSSSKEAEDVLINRHTDLRGQIHSFGHVSSETRNWLLSNAAAVHYPSSAEGFGFVPYEAAAVGTPTTFTAFGPLAEISQVSNAPRVWTVESHAADLLALLRDETAARERIDELLSVHDRLTWANYAQALIEFFVDTLHLPPVPTSLVTASTADAAQLASILSSRTWRALTPVRNAAARVKRRRG